MKSCEVRLGLGGQKQVLTQGKKLRRKRFAFLFVNCLFLLLLLGHEDYVFLGLDRQKRVLTRKKKKKKRKKKEQRIFFYFNQLEKNIFIYNIIIKFRKRVNCNKRSKE